MRICVLFPGIGYTNDKPLLYYSRKLALEIGYDVVPVSYGERQRIKPDDTEAREKEYLYDYAKAEAALEDINWEEADDILFVSKSVGTKIAVDYAKAHHLIARHILFTPLEETFENFQDGAEAIVFHGTADPWVETAKIMEKCEFFDLPLHLTEGGNHSLEVGDTYEDLPNLIQILKNADDFM